MGRFQFGFTLIELLIVVAVIGVLSGSVIAATNPSEQIARSRDAQRLAVLKEYSSAMVSYSTLRGSYPSYNANWVTTLINGGELKVAPASQGYLTCELNSVNNYCYGQDTTTDAVSPPILYVRLESNSYQSKCTTFTGSSSYKPWYLWSGRRSLSGLICVGFDPRHLEGSYVFVN